MEKRVYLDYAATTYVKEQVLEAMTPYFKASFGNPSGGYASARNVKKAMEDCREMIAACLGVKRKEVYFTAGGTESNNWALRGAAAAYAAKGKHIITTNAEHHAVLGVAEQMAKEGWRVTVLPVNRRGSVEAAQVEDAICEDTVLVSVMAANNEVGSISPVAQIGAAAADRGVVFHTDAVAAAGHMDMKAVGGAADLISLSAHKFYGPKGVGALVVKDSAQITPLLYGGMQERGRRAGTENIAGIAGMARALVLAQDGARREEERLGGLRDYMEQQLREKIPGVQFNGDAQNRLPNYVNVCLPGMDAKAALVALDLAGVECSAGSACTTGAVSPSHVLRAMGLTEREAASALRFTLGADTQKEDIDFAVGRIKKIYKPKD